MINQKTMKSPLIVMILAILMAVASIANSENMVHAQRNLLAGNNATNKTVTQQGNLSAVIDVDTLSKNIKERHPILLLQSP